MLHWLFDAAGAAALLAVVIVLAMAWAYDGTRADYDPSDPQD